MQQSYRGALIAALALAPLTACDRPTAPQLRNTIEQEQKAVFADYARLGTQISRLLMRAQGPSLGFGNALPVGEITIDVGGERARYAAVVLERVYVPPVESGGLTYTRRSLVAWDKVHKRGFAITAEDSVAAITLPTPELLEDRTAPRLWGRKGFVVESENGGREGSFGVDGRVEFSDAAPTGTCPFTLNDLAMHTDDGEGGWVTQSTRCETAQYHVAASAQLRRGDPNRSTLAAAFSSNESLRIDGQAVPGVRIVSRCGTKQSGEYVDIEFGCWTVMSYWRDNAQFAPQLGVDVSRIRLGPGDFPTNIQGGGRYWQPIESGSGVAFPCCEMFVGPARWVISQPDGTIIRQAEGIPAHDSVMKYVAGPEWRVRSGSRSLLFVQAQTVDRKASPYAIAVVDLTLLPCAAGTVRNEYPIPPGWVVPSGGCETPAPGRPQ